MSEGSGPPRSDDRPDGETAARGPLDFEPDTAEGQTRRWAHRQDPDLEPGSGTEPDRYPDPPRPRNAHSWLFGIVVALILVYIGLNTLRNAGSVSRGLASGQRLAPFAVPLALGHLAGDANVATGRGQGQRGSRPACSVRGPQILNSCQLTQGAPAVLAFVATGERRCADQLDSLQEARGRFAGVRFAAVVAGSDRGSLRQLIRRRGWSFPIGYDRDRAVFARYGIVDCPTITFAYPDGVAMRTTVEPLSGPQLIAALTRLTAASRRRGWTPPAQG